MRNDAPIIESNSFLFGGVEVVSGLHWNTLSSIQTIGSERPKAVGSSVVYPAGKASRKLASDFHANAAVWRQSSDKHPVQLGLAQTSNIKGGNGAQYSFASLVLEALSLHKPEEAHTTCIAIQDPNDEGFYYLVMQHEGSLIPGGDVFGPADTISQAINENASMGGFSIFAPENLGIAGSTPLPSADLLIQSLAKGALKAHRLIGVKPHNKQIGLVIVGLALVGGAVFLGNNSYHKYLEEESDRIAREEMAKLLAGKVEVVVIPTVAITDPKHFFSTCMTSFKEQRLFAGGWAFRDAECTPTTLTVYYTRNNSKVEYMSNVYSHAIFSEDGEQASVKTVLQANSTDLKQSELLESALVVHRLNNYAQSSSTQIELHVTAKVEQPSLPGRAPEQSRAETEPSGVAWRLTLPTSESLDNFTVKGSSLEHIHLTTSKTNLSITLKGTTYAKR